MKVAWVECTWGEENFVESFYGVAGIVSAQYFCSCLSLTLCLSMSFYYFLLEMIELSFRRRPASKPVVQSGTQLTPSSTWETVFLPSTHQAGPTPSPICENEKWFQTLPDIPQREYCPCLRTTGIAHIPYVL